MIVLSCYSSTHTFTLMIHSWGHDPSFVVRAKYFIQRRTLFMERIKYCGHVLHGGMRSPAPSKVDAVRNWHKPKTPKQMKGFLGVVNWYSIYIGNVSNIAAPLMTSLQGKYECVLRVDGRNGLKPVQTPVAIFGSLGVCIYGPTSRHWLISYSPVHLT